MKMVWCAQCAADVEVEADDQNGFACCVQVRVSPALRGVVVCRQLAVGQGGLGCSSAGSAVRVLHRARGGRARRGQRRSSTG